MMLHISALQSQVVKGRHLFRYSVHAHFTYRVGGKHCKRMASLRKHGKHSRGYHILSESENQNSPRTLGILVFVRSAGTYKFFV